MLQGRTKPRPKVSTPSQLFDEALAELEKAKQERKSDPILIYNTGMVYAAQGRRAEALQSIKELEEMSGASLSQGHWIAKIHAALNEKELALTWLERSLAAGPIGGFFRDEPVWDPIRSDPRFADLLRRMGIPGYKPKTRQESHLPSPVRLSRLFNGVGPNTNANSQFAAS